MLCTLLDSPARRRGKGGLTGSVRHWRDAGASASGEIAVGGAVLDCGR
jgi:hypothetical protein